MTIEGHNIYTTRAEFNLPGTTTHSKCSNKKGASSWLSAMLAKSMGMH